MRVSQIDSQARSTPLFASSALLVAVNLLPLLGVVYFDWDVFRLLALFWIENVFIGLVSILRLIKGGERRVFVPLFFLIHYGIFMIAHGFILVTLFGPSMPQNTDLQRVQFLFDYVGQTELLLIAFAIFASHLWSFRANFLGQKEYERLRPNDAMRIAYRRVVITHIALIAGGFLLEHFNQPVAGLVALIVVKTVLDLSAHRREHKNLARGTSELQLQARG